MINSIVGNISLLVPKGICYEKTDHITNYFKRIRGLVMLTLSQLRLPTIFLYKEMESLLLSYYSGQTLRGTYKCLDKRKHIALRKFFYS